MICVQAIVVVVEQTMASSREDHAAKGGETDPPVVMVRNLTKRFDNVVAVDALTFTLDTGTVTGFLGPNGAGKTTTLRMLLGLSRPNGGEALVFGQPYRDLSDPVRRVGALLESGDFDPDAAAGTTCAHLPSRPRSASAGSTNCSNWSNSTRRQAARSATTHSVCGSGSGWPPPCSATPSC